MALYTFFVQKQGSTYVEQVAANTVREAVDAWHKSSETNPGSFDTTEDITPVENCESVWCIDGRDVKDVFFLAHVVGPAALSPELGSMLGERSLGRDLALKCAPPSKPVQKPLLPMTNGAGDEEADRTIPPLGGGAEIEPPSVGLEVNSRDAENEQSIEPDLQGKFDQALKEFAEAASRGPLLPHEQVERGHVLLLSSEKVKTHEVQAKQAFEAALKQDGDHVPALLELGWYLYSREDDPVRARPFFDKALALARENMTEALSGRVACIEETLSEEAALDEYRRWSASGALIAREKLSPGLREWFPE